MKEISLGLSGKFALVDDSDYELLSHRRWHLKSGYACMKTRGKRFLMHRIIMDADAGDIIDHINRNKLDNRRCNLRKVDAIANGQNKVNNSDKYTGVFRIGKSNRWNMISVLNGVRVRETYSSEIAAAYAYNVHVLNTTPYAPINDLTNSGLSTDQLIELCDQHRISKYKYPRCAYSSDIKYKAGDYRSGGCWCPSLKIGDKILKFGKFEYEEHAIVAYDAVKAYIEKYGFNKIEIKSKKVNLDTIVKC